VNSLIRHEHSPQTVVLSSRYFYNLCTNWYVTVPEEDAFVLGTGTVDGPGISDSDFRSLLANLHGSLAVTDGTVSGWLKRTL
jgi:hypothetical protein